jgi:hypothetical protein
LGGGGHTLGLGGRDRRDPLLGVMEGVREIRSLGVCTGRVRGKRHRERERSDSRGEWWPQAAALPLQPTTK